MPVEGDEPIFGSPQLVALPLPCEDDIDEWEILAFDNPDVDWAANMECDQHYFILSIDLISTIKVAKKRAKGGFRKLGSPNKVVEKSYEKEESEEEDGGMGDE